MEALQPMATTIADLLSEREETIAVVETTAGGLISAALLSVPGASKYYCGGAVTYTGIARDTFLRVDMAAHPKVRSSSEQYARLIAAAPVGLADLVAVDGDLRPGDVRGHQVGSELDPVEIQVDGVGNGADHQGLGEAGNTDHQAMAPGKDRRQEIVDDLSHIHICRCRRAI